MGGIFLAVSLAFWSAERRRCKQFEDEPAGDPKAWLYANRGMILDGAAGSWGFNFRPALIPVHEILFSGMRKDNIPALVNPDFTPAGEATWLRPTDSVIGAAIGGEARAYPINILNWHECANDTLGGEPIAVTWCPWTGSAMVFSRRVAGRTLELGVSGLIYQSHTMLYDRQADPHDESLWSQILMRAVCGPAAARSLRLELLDCEVAPWSAWRRLHPETTVLALNTGFFRNYTVELYGRYAVQHNQLAFPVSRRSGRRRDLRNKDRLVIVRVGESERAYVIRDLLSNRDGVIRDTLAGAEFELTASDKDGPVGLKLRSPTPAAKTPLPRRAYAYWFAWDATHPRGEVYGSAKE
jgi:hypothetical protein